jgi:hypothetical protein
MAREPKRASRQRRVTTEGGTRALAVEMHAVELVVGPDQVVRCVVDQARADIAAECLGPADGPGFVGRIQLSNTQQSLAACSETVVEQDAYRAIRARQGCAAMYCGLGSACVTTEQGPACACTETTVAQQFVDLDGKPSVTCVPRTPPVDLRAGGDVFPDACATADCNGTCIDRNGIAVCACGPDMAAVATSTSAPRCATIVASTYTPGAQDYTAPLATLDVCAPAPPTCAAGAKYARVAVPIVGVDCGNANPPDDQITDGIAEAGCCQGAPPAPFFGGAAFVLALVLRPRRRRVRARSR